MVGRGSNPLRHRLGGHCRRTFRCAGHAQPNRVKALMTARRAAASTVEALVYSCRRGPGALGRADNARRLAHVDEQQLREVDERVQRFPSELQYKGRPAERWSSEQADTLLDKWNARHG